MPRPVHLFVLAVLAATTGGCFTRSVEQKVFEQDYTQVRLRHHVRFTSEVEKGFEHPFTISAPRAAHILSRIDLRRHEDGGAKREPAIPTESLYLIGEGMAKAFAQADPNEEVVVMSIRRTRRLGIFDRKHLTSLVAFRKDDLLHIHVGLSDWEVPPAREERLPEPKANGGNERYRVVPSRSMKTVGPAAVAVAWRDPIFAEPTRTHVKPSGEVVRRTILMESPEVAPPPDPQPVALPPSLAPETLRALADLEEARRGGEITESEYAERRREILAADPGVP